MGADTLARALALNALGGAQGPQGPQGPTGPAGQGGGSSVLILDFTDLSNLDSDTISNLDSLWADNEQEFIIKNNTSYFNAWIEVNHFAQSGEDAIRFVMSQGYDKDITGIKIYFSNDHVSDTQLEFQTTNYTSNNLVLPTDPMDNVKYVVNQIKGGYYDTANSQWKEGVVAIIGYNWEENGTQMSFNLGSGNIFQSNLDSLQYVDISKTNITTTPAYGFVQGCTKITTLKLPTTLYDFGLSAFFATQMSEIYIPYSYDGTHKVHFNTNVFGGDSAVTDIYFNVEKDNFTPGQGWTDLNATFGNHLYDITLHFTDQDVTVPANPENP